MYFKQRIFSWLDSYDIFDENGDVLYTVKGQLSFSHSFVIFDRYDRKIAEVNQKILTFLPKFEISINGTSFGTISKELTLFTPKYSLDRMGWRMEGDIFQWEYDIKDASGGVIAYVSKQLFKLMDTYEINVLDDENSLIALLFVLAVDAANCGD